MSLLTCLWTYFTSSVGTSIYPLIELSVHRFRRLSKPDRYGSRLCPHVIILYLSKFFVDPSIEPKFPHLIPFLNLLYTCLSLLLLKPNIRLTILRCPPLIPFLSILPRTQHDGSRKKLLMDNRGDGPHDNRLTIVREVPDDVDVSRRNGSNTGNTLSGVGTD